jgi:hypothetical protein
LSKTISRTALYDAVWTQPMTKLSQEFGVSDVGMAKACRKLAVPLPPRGYWARKAAGKPVFKPMLPPRPPGLAEETTIGGGNSYSYYDRRYPSNDDILGPVPPAPSFDEPIEDVQKRIEAEIGKTAIVHRTLEQPHPVVAKLLRQDDERRAKAAGQPAYMATWYPVIYDTPLQQRRLRLLSSIMMTAGRCGCTAELGQRPESGKPQDEFSVTVGDQRIALRVAVQEQSPPRGGRAVPGPKPAPTLQVTIASGARVWDAVDAGSGAIIREIALAIVLKGEEDHRASAFANHEWRLKRRVELIEQQRKEAEEAARRERERLAELERKRVERLLGEADTLRKARAIRAYVEEVRANSAAVPIADLELWAEWALAQANRIDPVMSGAFLTAIERSDA